MGAGYGWAIADDPLGVLIVDDDGSLRELVALALRMRDGFEVLGDAATGQDALRALVEMRPDIVVLDLGLPDLHGTELVTAIRAASPSARIVIFTGSLPEDVPEQPDVEAFVIKGDINVLIDVLTRYLPAARRRVETVVPAEPASVRAAREFVRLHCERWACTDAVESVTLIFSELVTNAVVHARTPAVLRLMRDDVVLRVEVADSADTSPEPRDPDRYAAGGRGLHIVSELAQAWGIDPDPPGKVVWAELALG